MNYKKFLNITINILLCFYGVSCTMENSVEYTYYKVITIRGISIEEYIKAGKGCEYPLQINLIKNKKYEGSVFFEKLKEINITSTDSQGNGFITDTGGKLGPVEYIHFFDLILNPDSLKGYYSCCGKTIDPVAIPFVAAQISRND